MLIRRVGGELIENLDNGKVSIADLPVPLRKQPGAYPVRILSFFWNGVILL